jgi:putative solute:sodium symporter small subunit
VESRHRPLCLSFARHKGDFMELSERHREYWRKNLIITAILLFVWFVATFVEGWYARELNNITFLGWPLGFYMSAQGSLIIYVIIIGIYARYMNALDKVYGVDEGEDQ